MGELRKVEIGGTGSYAPEKILSNADFERMVDTSDDWIVQRTGIRERHMVAADETNSDLASRAAMRALENAGIAPADLDLIIISTITPDRFFPSTACYTQVKIGAMKAAAMDLSAACTGFIYGVATGRSFVASGVYDRVLVVGSECMTRAVDFKDRNSCVLFGDGAGAVVLRPSNGKGGGEILDTALYAHGDTEEVMIIPAGGSTMPASQKTIDEGQHLIKIRGREVYKFAVTRFADLIEDAIRRTGISKRDVNLVIPHQVNIRIIESAVKKLDIPLERVYTNIEHYGNTSAASIPIALDEAVRAGRLRKGDLAILVAFGAGLTWGSCTFRF
ncbi:MAG: ketoacyl-ACP synthase III [Planctomycetes bacterium]|jgi:3-oxoacyl-[acyl-carrier-protein] synthase-3|nr:ketoacyl-ACP synthase III [Planctomycetota bacterium]